MCRLGYLLLAQELPNTRARATHYPVLVVGTSAVCCLLSVSPGVPLMLSRLRVVILAVRGGGVKVRYRHYLVVILKSWGCAWL